MTFFAALILPLLFWHVRWYPSSAHTKIPTSFPRLFLPVYSSKNSQVWWLLIFAVGDVVVTENVSCDTIFRPFFRSLCAVWARWTPLPADCVGFWMLPQGLVTCVFVCANCCVLTTKMSSYTWYPYRTSVDARLPLFLLHGTQCRLCLVHVSRYCCLFRAFLVYALHCAILTI